MDRLEGSEERDFATDVNSNKLGSYRIVGNQLPWAEIGEFGRVTAVSSGLPIFNKIFAFEEPSRSDLVAAVEWMESRGAPPTVTVSSDVLDEVEPLLADLGFEAAGSDPGMVLPSLDELPTTATDADIFEATVADEIDEFASIFAAVFDVSPEVTRRAFRPFETFDGNEWCMLLGEVGGEPVATGLLVRTGDVAGVYSIAVLEAYRRRGIGEAMTWEVLRAGQDAGCEVSILQATEPGYPLYRQMGFETVLTHHTFQPNG